MSAYLVACALYEGTFHAKGCVRNRLLVCTCLIFIVSTSFLVRYATNFYKLPSLLMYFGSIH